MGLKEWRNVWEAQCELVDEVVGESRVGRFFHLKERKSKFTTEVKAGCITFVTMCYIVVINALLLSDTGGPCDASNCTGPLAGNPICIFPDADGNTDPGYSLCTLTLRRDLVTATAASSAIGSVMMGLGANLPVAVAPGMGLNAYFAYTLVGSRGTGKVSYQSALAAVFFEGWIFVILSLTGTRKRLVALIPKSIRLAIPSGIGLFLAFVGLQSSEGLGVVSYDSSTLVTLGGCPVGYQVPTYMIQASEQLCLNGEPTLPPPSSSHVCEGHRMENATVWLGLSGLVLIALLMSRSVKGPIALGIMFVTVVSWIPGQAASYIGADSPLSGGEQRREFLARVVAWPNLTLTGGAIKFGKGFRVAEFWLALFTFVVVDLIDTSGTLNSMASYISEFVPGFVNDQQKFPRERIAFSIDGLSSVIGSLLGSSPLTAYIDSAPGIRAGARTGIAACVVAFWFMVTMFFTPLLATVPPYAVGPALITVGALMMMNVMRVRWEHAAEALPCFLTMVLMPMTYSITNGVIAGLVGYIIVAAINWLIDRVERLFVERHKGGSKELLPVLSSNNISGLNGNGGRTRPPRTPRERTPKANGLTRERSGHISGEKFLRPSGSAPPFLRVDSKGNAMYIDSDGSQRSGTHYLRPSSSASADGRSLRPNRSSASADAQGLGSFGSNLESSVRGGAPNLNRVSAFDFEADFVYPVIHSGSSHGLSYLEQAPGQRPSSPEPTDTLGAKVVTSQLRLSSDSAPPLDHRSFFPDSLPTIMSANHPSELLTNSRQPSTARQNDDSSRQNDDPSLQQRPTAATASRREEQPQEVELTLSPPPEQGGTHGSIAAAQCSSQQGGGEAGVQGEDEDFTLNPFRRSQGSAEASDPEAGVGRATEAVSAAASEPEGTSPVTADAKPGLSRSTERREELLGIAASAERGRSNSARESSSQDSGRPVAGAESGSLDLLLPRKTSGE